MSDSDKNDQLDAIRDRLLELFVQQEEAIAANDHKTLDRLKAEIREQRERMEHLRGRSS